MEIENRGVDFIVELKYLTADQGEKNVPAFSGYRLGVKFEFAEMQISGRQIALKTFCIIK